MKHRNIVCEKCGVEVIHSRSAASAWARHRLATPVVHIWFFKAMPSADRYPARHQAQAPCSRSSTCRSIVVLDPGTDAEEGRMEILSEDEYYEAIEKYGDDFKADMGGGSGP